MEKEYHLAIDIGASSGKSLIGYLKDGELINEVIYRFPNACFEDKEGHKTWDVNRLFNEVINSIKAALSKEKNIKTLSIDTWGCDYVLLDENDEIILPVYSYRDNRTEDIIKKVNSIISKEELFSLTGSQFQPFNTLYQLYKDKEDGRLKKAKTFLMIPEYLMFKLTGKKVHEITNASTTNLVEKDKYDYSTEILEKLGFCKDLFIKPSKVGTLVGDLLPQFQKEFNTNIIVKLCPTHDTASCVRFLNNDENSLYLSSGTWSLLGTKLDKYFISKDAFKNNFSNELGPNYVRFQKNIMGLWIIQNLLKEENDDILNAISLAKNSSYKEIVDVNDSSFLNPINMKEAIMKSLENHNLVKPKTKGDLYNLVFTSLAEFYKKTIDDLSKLLNKSFDKIFILGGGAKNDYLNRLVEEKTKLKVIAYPYECSALGNLLSQCED